jgi:hypothetical protein
MAAQEPRAEGGCLLVGASMFSGAQANPLASQNVLSALLKTIGKSSK